MIGEFLAPHELEHTKLVATETIVERANWKLVMENNRECHHCAGGHPELNQLISRFEDHDTRMPPPPSTASCR